MIDRILKIAKANRCAISVDYNDQTGQACVKVAKRSAQGFGAVQDKVFEPNVVELVDTPAAPVFDVWLERLIEDVDTSLEEQEKKQLILDTKEDKGDQGELEFDEDDEVIEIDHNDAEFEAERRQAYDEDQADEQRLIDKSEAVDATEEHLVRTNRNPDEPGYFTDNKGIPQN